MTKITSSRQIEDIAREYMEKKAKYSRCVLVCGGAGCVSSGCKAVKDALVASIEANGLSDTVDVQVTGCMGTCAAGPVILVEPDGVFYTAMTPERVEEMVKRHLIGGEIIEEYAFYDNYLKRRIPKLNDITFFKDQVRIVLRNCGRMEFASLEAYISRGGYAAIAKALTSMAPADVVAEMKRSGLRGRGGAGFPTGVKWEAGMNAAKGQKYMVCNADEGDPGAFMDRSVLEGDPHSVIEGMMIGGYAIGASRGYVYVRAEYPLAVERLDAAIKQAEAAGLLGDNILGTDFCFDIEIRIGAGAFVCGEETSLLASIEGERGEPRQKPPFPFESGLFEKPTIINNVETLASVAPIILKGADWYASYGTEKSKGTKVFALAGAIVNTGIIEVPMGTVLGDIIYKIGGGIVDGKDFKAIQSGGPSGGCLTAAHLNTSMDYESLSALGAIMGSGGLIVMNEDTCMVDTARYFMDFIRDESCGKCLPCRVGSTRMLEILERITRGEGSEGDVELLDELSYTLQQAAMCGLGQTAPNPVLSSIRYFRDEYDEHIRHHHCKAGVCSELFISPCSNACPASVNVPGYLALIAAGRFVDAYDLIRQENPMPSVCGRICTHPCEKKCRRSTVDEPLEICALKRFVADYAFNNAGERMELPSKPLNGKHVAVIGAGPSGLTCAYYLARLGYAVDVYESSPVAGGTLSYGIPEYRLPKAVLDREIREMQKSGFNIHLNKSVGKDVSFEDLRRANDALYVAIGTQVPQKAGVEGESLRGVYPGLTFLRDSNLSPESISLKGKRVAVIGGGNTAIDSARTAVRFGAKSVSIIYRRDRGAMPADKREVEAAIEEGIELIELAAPTRFIGDANGNVTAVECLRRDINGYDKEGRRNYKSIPGSEFTIGVDVVIPAVSQHADLPFVEVEALAVTPWGTLSIDQDTLMTSIEGVFAGGDVTRGSDVAITAIADGKNAAVAIDKYLGGEGKLNKGRAIDIPEIVDDDPVTAHARFEIESLPADKRCNNFDEVVLGFHKLNAMAESMRCLHCDRR
ncbi:MAG: FAD-dependent oxidoreductase [Oscillospiraceae bacterium]|nr:FAD-dependent oxidoreductase [Oscillospiraceae bacterium]